MWIKLTRIYANAPGMMQLINMDMFCEFENINEALIGVEHEGSEEENANAQLLIQQGACSHGRHMRGWIPFKETMEEIHELIRREETKQWAH